MKLDLLITGIGGQGTILASDIIGEVAIRAGYRAKKTDTLGMAQRGGSVISHVRIAREVNSALIRQGEVDILLAFEKLEAARWGHYLRPGGTALVNNHSLPPFSVSIGQEQYPDDETITRILRQRTERVLFIEGTRKAREMGNVKALNIYMLGCLSPLTPFKVQTWKDVISQHLPPNLRPLNLKAFTAGRKEVARVNLG